MILQIEDLMETLIGVFGIGVMIGFYLVMFILSVLCLKWGIKKVDGSELEFGSVFITALLNFIISSIPCGCFLAAYIISTRHKVTYGKGILAMILAAILPLIIGIIILVVFVVLTIGISEFMALFGF